MVVFLDMNYNSKCIKRYRDRFVEAAFKNKKIHLPKVYDANVR